MELVPGHFNTPLLLPGQNQVSLQFSSWNHTSDEKIMTYVISQVFFGDDTAILSLRSQTLPRMNRCELQ